ncbi:hypothetical protein PF008_g3454 [Phytophthora fragariae]|uniref:Protein kinase domain-containing protein n=1 Tax=Phytophthora fragariae TaxID=53985 RepID=A0A6G0SE41_9STRA|nr:hypothetical protein PF008_g3454 [Phytophthora fragariae]
MEKDKLIQAVKAGKLSRVKKLVRASKNGNEDAALVVAAQEGHLEIVHFLVEQCSADVNATDELGRTALMWAAKNCKVEIVQYLVDRCSADVHAKDNNGRTAYGLLLRDREPDQIEAILEPYLELPQSGKYFRDDPYEIHKTKTTDRSTSHFIPASEIELFQFRPNGGFGCEFRAKWLGVDAVVKLFRPSVFKMSFEEEIRLSLQLRHPNVLKTYGGFDGIPQLLFLVYEYASKGSLIEYVRSTQFNDFTMWKYLHEAALGLEYLHERKIIHSDLRCSNILIGSDGMAKVSNFGASRPKERSDDCFSGHGASERWHSPEALKGKSPPTFESDVYSLGMCILEASTKKMPWSTREYYNMDRLPSPLV